MWWIFYMRRHIKSHKSFVKSLSVMLYWEIKLECGRRKKKAVLLCHWWSYYSSSLVFIQLFFLSSYVRHLYAGVLFRQIDVSQILLNIRSRLWNILFFIPSTHAWILQKYRRILLWPTNWNSLKNSYTCCMRKVFFC